MNSRQHELKCWPSYFEAIRTGEKTFEMRKNDRDYAVGDVLVLKEWDPSPSNVACIGGFKAVGGTGRLLTVRVTFILHGKAFGVESGYCCMSIKRDPSAIAVTP